LPGSGATYFGAASTDETDALSGGWIGRPRTQSLSSEDRAGETPGDETEELLVSPLVVDARPVRGRSSANLGDLDEESWLDYQQSADALFAELGESDELSNAAAQ
jgi:hypothetical protein